MRQLASTKEVAQLLGVNEKMIYALITEKCLPATKITGKWLFPLHLVEQWIERNTLNHPDRDAASNHPDVLIVAGSDDLLLDKALILYSQSQENYLATFAALGSLGGLRAMKAGLCHIAASHLREGDLTNPEREEYNFSHARRELAEAPVVVNLCFREQGILLAPGNPHNVSCLADMVRKKLTIINRQPGAGTRILLDAELALLGENPRNLPGYDHIVARHLDVGLEILARRADAGIGIRAVAGLLNLPFIPLQRERFDLLIPRSRYFDRPVQAFLSLLTSPRFTALVEHLEGYDISRAGRVVFPGENL